MSIVRRASGMMLAVLLLCTMICVVSAEQTEQQNTTTVLFTHDLHARFIPQATASGGETGGYARLKTALDAQREQYPNALTVDGGDFSVGSLIQTLYTTKAPELRTMGLLGYDATTAGNHEFDHTSLGFAQMLHSAADSGDVVPALLMANYRPAQDNPHKMDLQRAMSGYGVQEHMLIERGGITYGIFGLMGKDANSSAPVSGFELLELATSAQRCVDALKAQGAQFIIALSHSGTDEKQKKSEDEQLAKAVAGIDLIISAHTHTTVQEPIVIGDTYIVSSGPYCENLGSITFHWNENGKKELLDYKLIPIDQTIVPDQAIAAVVESWKAQVGSGYLAKYGLRYDQILTRNDYDLLTPISGVQQGNALGELVSDAFVWAVSQAEGGADEPIIAVTADGVLRAPLHRGALTVSHAFDVLSLGVGADGSSGYPLVSVWLTGKELKAALEVDASVTPFMPSAQLYISGMEYAFNTNRMFFNRITDAKVLDSAGQGVEIEEEQLYRVVTGMYSAQMLGAVQGRSMGLLRIEPKDAQGERITDFTKQIVYDKNGGEIKEWYALATYLADFGEEGVPSSYAKADGRKQVSGSWNPIQLLKNINEIGLCALLALVLIIVILVLVAGRLSNSKRRRRYGAKPYTRRRMFR